MIKIHNFTRVSQGCKVAEFDVELPNIGFMIYGMTLIKSKDKSWVDYPKKCKEENGEKKFIPHCKFTTPEKSQSFMALVHNEIKNILSKEVDL